METQEKKIRKSFLYIFIVFQSIMCIGIIIWAITQKVEAEKQKVLALTARDQAARAESKLEKETNKNSILEKKYNELLEKALIYKEKEIAAKEELEKTKSLK